MTMTDPLGDMLTRIRNAQIRKKDYVHMPASRFRGNVLEVLEREGYIRGFKKIELSNHRNNFEIELKYIDGEPVIKEISRISFVDKITEGTLHIRIQGAEWVPALENLKQNFILELNSRAGKQLVSQIKLIT